VSGFTHEPGNGGTPEWYTPPAIFNALGLTFDLDPCAPALPAAAWIPARQRYTSPQDGMALPWHGRIWLNPPYARETAHWIGRLAEHGDGIALVFARIDTPWWQNAARAAHAVCFIAGRVEFIPGHHRTERSRAGAGSCLLAYGDACALALARSGLGTTMIAEPACVRAQAELWSAYA
jgi:hypothetical protein